jgi:ABC-type branched-subunit amino acid transport system ATPase component
VSQSEHRESSVAIAELPVTQGLAAIEAVEVSVRFGGIAALTSVSMTVGRGQVVGLVGPNGAGKSTLFAVLSGLQRPDGGQVILGGDDVTRASPEERAKRGLARTFQHPELFADMSVREHIELGWRLRHARRRLVTDLVLARGLIHWRDPAETAAVDAILTLLKLDDVADREALELPLARTRLVEVGRALATSPQVLLLDEPVAGLDPGDRERLLDVLRQVVKDHGTAMVMVEHDVEMVLAISDVVCVLDFGTRIAMGTPSEIRVDPAVRAAYLGDHD